MTPIPAPSPARGGRGKQKLKKPLTAYERQRKRVFCLCSDLGIGEDERRGIAGQFRADGKATMEGMGPVELARMEHCLFERNRERIQERRPEKLRQHKRVDGQKGGYASYRALYFLRSQAEILWGDEWEVKLHQFIKRQTKYDLFWDSRIFPRDLHHQVTEGVLAMIRKAAMDPSRNNENGRINERRRAAETR